VKVAINRVNLGSLGKMGCLLGTVAAFLPSLLCGLLALGATRLAVKWLESWQALSLTLFDQEVAHFDLVHFLQLERALTLLQGLTSASGAAVALLVLALALTSGALLAVMIILVGLSYNLVAAATGGLVVEMKAVDPRRRPEPGPAGKKPPPESTV
jgi:hypothetical protein